MASEPTPPLSARLRSLGQRAGQTVATRASESVEASTEEDRRRPWRPTASFRVATLGLFLLAVLAAMYVAKPILLPIFIAMLLGLLLSPAVGALERWRVPRPLGAIAVLALGLVLVGSAVVNLSGPANEWINAGPEQLSELRRKLRLLQAPIEALRGATERVSEIAAPPIGTPPREVVVERRSLSGLVSNTQSVLFSAATVLILLYFLLASGDMFLRKLIRIIPNLRDKIRAVEISRTIQAQISRYFAAITLINLGLGIATTIAMSWIGLPTPALIGTVVALLNFIPYLGPITSLGLISIISILTFDTVTQMVVAPSVFALIAMVEGQFVQPVLLGRHLSTTPVVLFLWVLFWGWMWGVGGVAVAVPILVVTKICADHIPSWRSIAEFLGRDERE